MFTVGKFLGHFEARYSICLQAKWILLDTHHNLHGKAAYIFCLGGRRTRTTNRRDFRLANLYEQWADQVRWEWRRRGSEEPVPTLKPVAGDDKKVTRPVHCIHTRTHNSDPLTAMHAQRIWHAWGKRANSHKLFGPLPSAKSRLDRYLLVPDTNAFKKDKAYAFQVTVKLTLRPLSGPLPTFDRPVSY